MRTALSLTAAHRGRRASDYRARACRERVPPGDTRSQPLRGAQWGPWGATPSMPGAKRESDAIQCLELGTVHLRSSIPGPVSIEEASPNVVPSAPDALPYQDQG